MQPSRISKQVSENRICEDIFWVKYPLSKCFEEADEEEEKVGGQVGSATWQNIGGKQNFEIKF